MSADDQRAAEFPMCWYSPSLGFLVPDPMSDDGQGVIQVANGRVMLCLPDDAARLGAVDRLRAELAETRVAGDALAEVLGRMKPDRGQATADAMDALDGWRSVRGDAPTESVSWNDLDRATATIRRVMPSDATTVICGVDVEEVAREKLPDGAFRVTTRRRGDAPAPAEPPAVQDRYAGLVPGGPVRGRASGRIGTVVEVQRLLHGVVVLWPDRDGNVFEPIAGVEAVPLPVTLSSVDDVAAVCERVGLGAVDMDSGKPTWAGDKGVDVVMIGDGPSAQVWTAESSLGPVRVPLGWPSSLLVAAIEAARGGSR